ncbi:receptor-like protein 6 [Cicer arietinum]|uniref:Receptor-like protein 53 n=1 Tax=Cicer arietinum TaxID=3827 RepID=A0A1S3DZR2_CICAR|nr:receptor-like protein 53 [Cicer arietinum]
MESIFVLSFYLSFYMYLLLLLTHFTSYTFSLCNHHDKFALLQFKNSLAITSSKPDIWYVCSSFSSKTESWTNNTDCCEWDGVMCNPVSGHVISLDLSCNNLKGVLHPNSTIFQLNNLQQLNLAFNDFSDSLMHAEIGNLVSLTHLNLSNTGISGNIPHTISYLSKLVSLDLSNNEYMSLKLNPFTWKKLIHNATNLRELHLEDVNMSSIRESSLLLLKNLSSSLVSLNLAFTELQGNLSSDLFSLPNLKLLDLSSSYDNKLGGQLPKSNWTSPLRYLDLSNIIFSGQIPNVFENLNKLEYLSLSGNNFSGQVPSSLFNLIQLSTLDLSNNNLVGPIPTEITKDSKLEVLYLDNNKLNGTIPHWCYSLPSMFVLSLGNNKLTGSIGEFSTYSLSYLYLSKNNIQGEFPNSIYKLQNLTVLSLSSTNLSGSVDFNQFSNFKKLYYLDLSHNSFLSVNIDSSVDSILPNLEQLYLSSCNINSFPKFLARLQNLQVLDLSNNKIQGKVPEWFHEKLLHSWNNTEIINLSFNKLQGDLPLLSSTTQIFYFLASNNNFTGQISSSLCNASSLQVLNLAHNNLKGTIPQCLGGSPSLFVLDLQMNNLSGSIPTNFSKGNSFETIKLNGNRLEGPLPHTLSHCTYLEVLDLGGNNIEGTFPNWLETLQGLQVLILRSNKLHGPITCSTTKHSFSELRILDVSNNNFSGLLPTSCIKNFQGMKNVNVTQTGLQYMGGVDYYNDSVVVIMKGFSMELTRILTTFTTIDLSNNMFEGEIPKVIGELNSLKGLNLSNNGITGTIPQSLSNLRNLEWLDMSRNHLKGEIPESLTNLNFLSVLNLSQNQLEGMIPTGKQFDTFGNDSYEGNAMLCGLPLSKSCKNDKDQQPQSNDEEESSFGWKSVAIGYGCGAVFGMLLGYNLFLTGKPRWLANFVENMFSIRLKRINNIIGANRR